jgi:DNA repair protein RadC
MAFKDLPAHARPREKLIARGAGALADAELLALLLRTGVAGKNVLQLAQELLEHFGGLSGLLQTSAEDLKVIKGMGGDAKRAELIAVLELARRAMAERLKERAVFDSPGAVKQYLQLHIGSRPYEVFAVLFRGTLTQTSVYPREVVTRALHHHAAAVVLSHNHPSGSIEPSRADETLTQTLSAALSLIDVRVLDHVIVSAGQALSMAEKGLL